ncbi:MAG: hypothetical protein CMC81_01515 [Flavobacteriaceae bacterium]|nr:hypothetical protein [Flavobacteriaceae bacterium]
MFKNFFLAELRYSLKQPMSYLFFLIVFLLVFAANVTNDVTIGGAVGNVYRNAPYVITIYSIILSLNGLLFAAAFFNNSALRDYKNNFQEIIYTTPIDKFGYYLGKFFASLILSTIPLIGVFFGIIIGSKVAPLMGWIEADRFGPFYLDTFINNYLIFILPNMFIGGTIIYSLAQEFKNTMVSFVGAMLILVGYIIAGQLSSDIDNETIAALVDVFGIEAYNVTSKYYTPLEKNILNPSLSGLLLYNRLIWIGFASIILFISYKRFSFKSKSIKNKVINEDIVGGSSYTATERPVIKMINNSNFSDFKSFFKINMTSIYKHVTFKILFVFSVIQLIAGLVSGYEYLGLKSYPLTYFMVDQISGSSGLFILIILVFFSGELVWRDRDVQLNEVIDSTAHSTLIPLFSKTLSLFSLSIVLHLILVFIAVIYQLMMGFTKIDFSLYLMDYLYNLFPVYLTTCATLVAIQVIVNHKYLAYMVSVIVLLLIDIILLILDVNSNMLSIGSTPYMIYSDLNGFGPSNKGVFWFNLYWILFGLLFLMLSGTIWNRGSKKSLKERLKGVLINTNKLYLVSVSVVGFLFILVSSFVFYNTQVLNSYKSSDEYEKIAVSYENKYKKYKDLPFPKIVNANYNIDLFPKIKKANILAYLTLVNQNENVVDSILLNINKEWELDFDFPNANIISKDEVNGVHFYAINPPMLPGDTLVLKIKNTYETKGFSNGGETTSIVKNGSFLNNEEILPNVGYDSSKEIGDKNKRKKLGLPIKDRMPELEIDCNSNCNENYGSRGFSDFIDVETTISTSSDQIAIAPGTLVKEWKENDRNYFKYKIDHPSLNFYSFISANYKVAKRKWKDVDIEIYYDSKHSINIEMMLDAVENSLIYYTNNFGPYYHNQARIIEFPRFSTFAQAFPGTMPYSESFGFIIDLEDEEENNVIEAVIAHEMAHQWWAHQVIGANMQGATFLSESFSEYSSLMTMKKRVKNPMKMREFLKYDHDRYLRGRSQELEKELPLYKVENQQYIHYGKGSVILYALQDYIGEDKVNSALKEFLEKYKYKTPYPTSLDFIEILEPKVPDSLKYLINDWFKDITLYDNRLTNASAKKLNNGKFEINIEVETSKIKSDSIGNETKVAVNEWIDIGVFSDEDEENLIYQKRVNLTDSLMNFSFVVDTLPLKAAIDPRHILIDRVYSDNIKSISFD